MVNEVYGGLRLQNGVEVDNVCAIMAAYLEDLEIGSENTEKHLKDLREVF